MFKLKNKSPSTSWYFEENNDADNTTSESSFTLVELLPLKVGASFKEDAVIL